jgi:predicted nucleotidyltransferase
MKSTSYFNEFASQKHPEVRREWIEQVLANPVRQEVQPNNRISALLNEGMNFKVPLLWERDLGRGQSRGVTEPT